MVNTFWVGIGYSGWTCCVDMLWTCCVDMVSRVVTPRETRAGTAFGSSQKLTWMVTIVNDDKAPWSRYGDGDECGDEEECGDAIHDLFVLCNQTA